MPLLAYIDAAYMEDIPIKFNRTYSQVSVCRTAAQYVHGCWRLSQETMVECAFKSEVKPLGELQRLMQL